MASNFSNRVINPFIICVALFSTAASFTLTIWHSCGVFPQREIYEKINLAIICISWALNLVDTLWIQIASNAVREMVQVASTNVLMATRGTRALGMAWTTVAMITLSLTLSVWIQIKENRARRHTVEKEVTV
jgi:Ca2+ regulator and membrane fusion protein Fig1